VLGVTSLALWTAACSDSEMGSGTSNRVGEGTYAHDVVIKTSPDYVPPGQAVRGDADSDNPRALDGSPDIDTTDVDDDSSTPQSYRYPDADDAATLAYGAPADGRLREVIAAAVARYYVAAAQRDGATACSLLSARIAGSVASDYGASVWPARARAGKTCMATMSKIFANEHALLGSPAQVLSVRVKGSRGQVVVGSRRMPASRLVVERVNGVWRLMAPFANPLQ